ncbi:TPA: DUF551 domain-containing protein [Enterobacter hormaechei subsp. steigerwaltii]|nr:DUF551 domain-containing protein [Enterobacter hormaechei subsp. steigerwaltii]
MTLTKEWLQQTIAELEEERDAVPGAVNEDAAMALAAMKLALASLEAEAVGEVVLGEYDDCGCHPEARVVCIAADGQADWENFKDGTRLYSAPPAPVSVPDLKPVVFLFVAEDGAVAYSPTDWPMEGFNLIGQIYGDLNASRAAMLQGADRPQNEPQNIPENIPATQFKPVADLYGLTSPTGGETSFTFDAVEARDFIDGGWSCQEYVELGRFQEAMLQNGNSPAQSDCCPEQNYIAPAQDGDSPVLPDGWVACSERMPDIGTEIFYFCQDDGLRDCGIVSSSNFSGKGNAELYVHAEGYDLRFGVDISHWMPLPASPQQK